MSDRLKTRALEVSKTAVQFNAAKGVDLRSATLLKQNKASVVVEANTTTVWLGDASVTIFNRDGRLLSYRSDEKRALYDLLTEEQCEKIATDFLAEIGMKADGYDTEVHNGDHTFRFNVQAQYGKFLSTQLISIEVSRSTGAVKEAYLGPWMDHSKLALSKLATAEDCVDAAKNAYSRFEPFPIGKVVQTQLMLGMPNWGPQVANELLPDHLTLIDQRIAQPILRVTIADQTFDDGRVTQIIDVDARSGRVLSILPKHILGGRVTAVKRSIPQGKLSLVGTSTAGVVRSTGVAGKPSSKGVPITFESDTTLVTLLWVKSSGDLWLFNGASWETCHPDSTLASELKNYKSPSKFGKTK
ncbi:MAG: hypothetical protein KF784_08115 [Fimbriimonadaceae bacterium]|nr:hypothetical protein [Fimbriimonadaceae bacterium]